MYLRLFLFFLLERVLELGVRGAWRRASEVAAGLEGSVALLLDELGLSWRGLGLGRGLELLALAGEEGCVDVARLGAVRQHDGGGIHGLRCISFLV